MDNKRLLKALKNHLNYSNMPDAKEYVEEYYRGEFDSMGDFAKDYTEGAGEEIPTHLSKYINWDKYAEEQFSFDFFYIKLRGEKTIHVFRNA